MLKERENLNEIIKRYMSMAGYELSDKSKIYHSLDSFVFTYINSSGIKDNIKIETNYSLRCHVLSLEHIAIETLNVFSPTKVFMLNRTEIFASKIVALLSRTAARDLYDINNMLYYGLFAHSEENILRKCVVFYSAIGSETVPEFFNVECIENLTRHKIKTDLIPVIRKSEKFDLEAAKRNVKAYLSEFLVLTEKEKQFLEAFRNNEYCPELLFEGRIVERIRNHPMALWKTRKNK